MAGAEEKINGLVHLWLEQRHSQDSLTLVQICEDCPELLPQVQEALSAVLALEKRFQISVASLKNPSSADGVPETVLPGKLPSSGQLNKPTPQLPGYQILGELGRGGMGVVYRARQVKLNREVAVKMILAGTHAGESELARFRTEAEAIARLQHPNIVQIFEIGEWERLPYFSLEFVDGSSLNINLAGTPQNPREAAQLVATLAQAMKVAHQAGIIHRDLKPANILLTRYGIPKITDFGLAKQLDSTVVGQSKSGAFLGTPSYMAPEQAEGESKLIGPATDVYALGAILYEMLTGRPPFKAETPLDTVMQVIAEEPVPPRRLNPKVPRDLETICLKCLRKEAHNRYLSAQDLADDLERYQAGKPIKARPVGKLERGWQWARRNPSVAASAALTMILAVGLLVGGMWYQREEGRKLALAEQSISNAEEIALAEMRAGRFASAEKILKEASRRLDEESDLADLRPRLDGRRNRLHRLVQFYSLADETERFTLLQDNAQALAAAEKALSVLEVFAHKEWWTLLPDEDLTPAQGKHLQNEAYRQILYATGLRATDAVTSQNPEHKTAKFRSALEVLAHAEKFRPSRSGSMLNRFCRFGLNRFFEINLLLPLPKGEPTSAVDYYFLGVLHCMIHKSMEHPGSRDLRLVPNSVLSDLDFNTPLPAAERLLSEAARIEPQHYFTYLFHCMALEQKPKEAEQVAQICIAMRPDYGIGYEARATALTLQLYKATYGKLMGDLYDRAMADWNLAIRLDRPTFRAYLGRGLLYGYKRKWAEAATDIGTGVEQVPHSPFFRRLHASVLVRARDLTNYRLACERNLEHFRQTKLDQNSLADLAIACVQAPLHDEGRTAEVLRIAKDAVAADPQSAHTRYGLGAAYYRMGQYEKAVTSLNESLELGARWASKPVNWPLLAMAHFRLGQVEKAKEWLAKVSVWHAELTALPVLGVSTVGLMGSPLGQGPFLAGSSLIPGRLELTAGKESYFTWVAEWWWDGVEFENLLCEAKALIAP